MTLEKEQEITRSNNWHRLGRMLVDVKVPLTDSEKLQIGEVQSKALMNVEKFKMQKKQFDDELNTQIKQSEHEAYDAASALQRGYRTEEKEVPCFLDLENKERVYFDVDTGEEVKREPMHHDDRQISLN